MAQYKQSPQDLIKNAFTPQIAVMCTNLAEKSCQKNNLDFIELLQPFCKLNNDVSYRDPNGSTHIVRNLKLTFLDISWVPPQPAVARKLLNTSVSSAPESKNTSVTVGNHNLEIPASAPWFESWRQTFLKVQYPSDHEFTKHFLACILVVSSADKNIDETFDNMIKDLNQVHNKELGKLPKWFNSVILKYFVIIHDNIDGDINGVNESFDAMKRKHGPSNCFLLKLNSRPSGSSTAEHLPDPWNQFISNSVDVEDFAPSLESKSMKSSLEIGQEADEVKNINYHPLSPVNDGILLDDFLIDIDHQRIIINKPKLTHGHCLSTEDIEQVKFLIYEFSKGCLIPYIEKQIHSLNEVVANRKGVSKSLFSATKRWFTQNKPGTSAAAINNLVYSPDSPELQIRKMGDLYFMLGQYSLAFQTYHLAKREYNTDQAWLYYAGALEMAALAAFMANQSTKKTCDYMEESITTYLNTCKMPQFATRATILGSECLKFRKMYGEAAHQLIRMISEESDLRSALLLEQASYCFLQTKMVRKYAFHMVLAGHRFAKAAQRKFSLKCYKQAYQVYENTGWDLATDHIHYTIGRQANNLQQFDEAVSSFAKLLTGESKQTAQQQATYLKEYLTILGNKLRHDKESDVIASLRLKVPIEIEEDPSQEVCPILPVPELDIESLRLLACPSRPISTPGKTAATDITLKESDDEVTDNKWTKLEEMIVHEAEGVAPLIFKPMVTLYGIRQLESMKPVAIINEPIQIALKLVNSLQTLLNMADIHLLWTYKSADKQISNLPGVQKHDDIIKTYITKALIIGGSSTADIILSLIPLAEGTLTINSFCYTLTSSTGTGSTGSSSIKGKQPITIPVSNPKNASSEDSEESTTKPLEIDIVCPAPCLQVLFAELNTDFLMDEIRQVKITFCNNSAVPLQNIYIATPSPHILSDGEVKDYLNFKLSDLNVPALRDKMIRKNHVTKIYVPGRILSPGKQASASIWLKAPLKKGVTKVDLLIYYQNLYRFNIPKYRLVRNSWDLLVQESLLIDVSTQASHNSKSVEELVLAMKITNLNKTYSPIMTEIKLLNVGLLSKYWTLTKEVVRTKYIVLNSQESAHILLKAKRSVHEWSKYSNVPLTQDQELIQSLSTSFIKFARKFEKPCLTMYDDYESFKFKENKDGMLLVQWQAMVSDGNTNRVANGQTSVPIEINRRDEDVIQMERILSDTFIHVCDKTILEEEKAQNTQKQVSYNLVYPAFVSHNFLEKGICLVPVKILLHSIVDNKILDVFVNTTEPSVTQPEINKSSLFCTYASSNFCWLGNSKNLRTLHPLTTESISLTAAVSGPGTFDIGTYIEVFCKSAGQKEDYVLQSCQIHPTLVVKSI
uniref:Trafficking protein particle complex subunit 8 n=1 Tax=Diabrotica virgifera virgifera TaxID=50390 RepID=A0A6P7FSR0_DIAVI